MDNEYLKDEYTQVLFANVIFYCIVNAKLAIKLENELSVISQKDTESINENKIKLSLCGINEHPGRFVINFAPVEKSFLELFVKIIKKYQENNFFDFRFSNQHENKFFVESEEKLISKLFELAQEYKNNKNKISGEDNE